MKCEIVAASMLLGASVSVVARQYYANEVFNWRHRYQLSGEAPQAALSTPRFVPMTITHHANDEPRSRKR